MSASRFILALGVAGAALASAALVWRLHSDVQEAGRTARALELALARSERRLAAVEAAQAAQARLLFLKGVQSVIPGVAPDGPAPALAEDGEGPAQDSALQLESSGVTSPTFSEAAEVSLSGQPANLGWTREVRGRMLEVIAERGTSAELEDVDCRATLCRIVLHYTSAADQLQTAMELSEAAPFDGGAVFEHAGEGSNLRTTLYIARPGVELAAIQP